MKDLEFKCYFCPDTFATEIQRQEHSLFYHHKLIPVCESKNKDTMAFKLFSELKAMKRISIHDLCPFQYDETRQRVLSWDYEQAIRFQSILNKFRELDIDYKDSPAYNDLYIYYEPCNHHHKECGVYDPSKEYAGADELNQKIEKEYQKLKEYQNGKN